MYYNSDFEDKEKLQRKELNDMMRSEIFVDVYFIIATMHRENKYK